MKKKRHDESTVAIMFTKKEGDLIEKLSALLHNECVTFLEKSGLTEHDKGMIMFSVYSGLIVRFGMVMASDNQPAFAECVKKTILNGMATNKESYEKFKKESGL